MPGGLLFSGEEAEDLAGELVGEAEAGLGAGVEIDGFLVEPDHCRFSPGILRASEVVGGVD